MRSLEEVNKKLLMQLKGEKKNKVKSSKRVVRQSKTLKVLRKEKKTAMSKVR